MATTGTLVDPPSRVLDTQWGRLRCTAISDDRVDFSTGSDDSSTEHELTLQRVRYSVELPARRGEPARKLEPRHVDAVIAEWSFERCVNLGLRRPDGGVVTQNAARTFLHKVLPGLVDWLGSSDGRALLGEAQARLRDQLLVEATAAHRILGEVLVRLGSVTREVRDGGPVSRDGRDLVAAVHRMAKEPELRPWLQHAPELPRTIPPPSTPTPELGL